MKRQNECKRWIRLISFVKIIMIALSLRNKVKQLHTRNNQNVKKHETASLWWVVQGASWTTSKCQILCCLNRRWQVFPKKPGDIFDSQKNLACPKMNFEQSTNQGQHRNRIRREQRRTTNSTAQKANRAWTTSYPSSPISWVPKEQCSAVTGSGRSLRPLATSKTMFRPRSFMFLFLFFFC